jgi:hypothetical protein
MRQSSTGGHWRTRGDTEGHVTAPVRDREAPGSNPGPPTNFEFKIADFRSHPQSPGHSRGTDSLESRGDPADLVRLGAPLRALSSRNLISRRLLQIWPELARTDGRPDYLSGLLMAADVSGSWGSYRGALATLCLAQTRSMGNDQKETWEAHEQAEGHWVSYECHRHFWPLYEEATLASATASRR